MAERYTILAEHPRGILTREERERGMKAVTDLQIDRAFRIICPEFMYRDAFLNVLASPLTDPGEIRERQRIIRYFEATPQALDRLIETIRRLLLSKNQWDAERSRLMASRRVDPQDKSLVLWVARENLVLTAHFMRILLVSVKDIYECLEQFGANEGWLGRLKENARGIAAVPGTDTFLDFADKIEKGLSQAHTYDVEFDLGEDMRATVPFLRDFAYTPLAKKPEKPQWGGIFSLFAGKKNEAEPKEPVSEELPEAHVGLPGAELGWSLEMAARAVQECDRMFTSFLRTVTDRFSDLEEELYFFRCVTIYLKRFSDLGVKTVYPEILPEEENTLRFRNLSDLLLLTESMHVSSVIPNDVNYEKSPGGPSGMLVTGRNNSGKTVYLRSIGTAVLLAQCGLPIPAEGAEISVRRRIFTAFARAEGELVPLSSAGRFEEEVAEIAEILRGMEPDSLLLLNETFQTTAYDEGAEGMAPILEYLSAIGCGFIFVTHLTKLTEMYREVPGVAVMRTSDDPRTRYRISRIA